MVTLPRRRRKKNHKDCLFPAHYVQNLKILSKHTSLMDCDIIRSSKSWEVVEEAKENWCPESIGISSDSPGMSSGIEVVVVQQDEVFADLETILELEEELWFGVNALETSRAEELQDLDRNSIGILGLSGRWVTPEELCSDRPESLRCNFSSMKWKLVNSKGLMGFEFWTKMVRLLCQWLFIYDLWFLELLWRMWQVPVNRKPGNLPLLAGKWMMCYFCT